MTDTDDKTPEPYEEFSPEGYHQPVAYVPFDGNRDDPGCLWDLHGPAIIIDGVDSQWLETPPRTYFNQVGGCACFAPAHWGVLMMLPDRKAQCFDPSFWYNGYLGMTPSPLHCDGGENSPEYQRRKRCHDEFAHRHNPELWDSVVTAIEAEVNAVIGEAMPGASDFRVFGAPAVNVEAWVRCEFTLEREGEPPKMVMGILTWENCD